MRHDDGFDAYWTEEKNWLVEVVILPKGEPDENAEQLDWIGRLFGFATATDTRMLAQVGDVNAPAYELWFSFDSAEHKQTFLELVRRDGYADPDEECCFDPPPSPEDLPNLRPLAYVFPKEHMERITAVAIMTAQALGDQQSSIN